MYFFSRKKGFIPAMSCSLWDVLIPSITFRQALSMTEAAWLARARVCCLLKQCYPTASAESVSAVFMLCQGEKPGRRLLHQPFLLFNRTMNTGKCKTEKVKGGKKKERA